MNGKNVNGEIRKVELMRKKGFTLIELLVVISVIALLVSILLPAFGKARLQAKRTVCMCNLRQQGLGLEMYSQDYNGKYPPQTNRYWGQNTYWSAWRDPLLPYVNDDKNIFTCPVGGKRWGFNSYRLRGKWQTDLYMIWDLNEIKKVGEPSRFHLIQDTAPVHNSRGLRGLEKSHGEELKEDHPVLYGDLGVGLDIWIDFWNEGW